MMEGKRADAFTADAAILIWWEENRTWLFFLVLEGYLKLLI